MTTTIKSRVHAGEFTEGMKVEIVMNSGVEYKGTVIEYTARQSLIWVDCQGVMEQINTAYICVAMSVTEEVHKFGNKYSDNLDEIVFVQTSPTEGFSGRIVDYSPNAPVIWVHATVRDEWVMVNYNEARIDILPEPEEITEELAAEVAAAIPSPLDVKNITEIKGEIKEELESLYGDVDYYAVKVFNSDEGDVEIYDAEFNAYDEDGKYLFCVYFGTYYDEKEAVKAAKAMRTKLAKYFNVIKGVESYAC